MCLDYTMVSFHEFKINKAIITFFTSIEPSDPAHERDNKRRKVDGPSAADCSTSHTLVYKDVCFLCLLSANDYDKHPGEIMGHINILVY